MSKARQNLTRRIEGLERAVRRPRGVAERDQLLDERSRLYVRRGVCWRGPFLVPKGEAA